MSLRPWVRIPPAPSNDWPADGRAEAVTGQGLVQSAGPDVQLASISLQGQPVRRGGADTRWQECRLGNSWLRSPQTATSLPPVAGSRSRLPLSRGRSSAAQSTRLSGERSPVRVRSSPLHGGRGVDGSTRGCEPRRRRFEPGRPPLTHADAEQRRAQQAVTLSPRAVVVRLHPSAPRLVRSGGCSSTGRAPRLQRGRCRFDSDRLHSLRLRSVNGKHAPFVRPRCGFESCRRLLPSLAALGSRRAKPGSAERSRRCRNGRAPSGRSSDGRAPGRHSGEARSIRVVRSRRPVV